MSMKPPPMKTSAHSDHHEFLVTMKLSSSPGAFTKVWHAGKPLFLSTSNRWLLEKTGSGFRVRDLDLPTGQSSKNALSEWGEADAVSGKELQLPDALDRQSPGWIRIAPIKKPSADFVKGYDSSTAVSAAKATVRALEKVKYRVDAETVRYFKIAGGICAAVFLIIGISWLIPEKAVDPDKELVPEEFAKVILEPQDAKEPTPEQVNDSATTAAESAVAQAFQAEALKGAVSKLIQGGMTKLMTQMDMAGQKTVSGKLFISDNGQATVGTGNIAGMKGGPNVKVSGIGGGSGGGVGYGTGGKTGVAGQGGGYVSLDLGGASVQQGLSLEQVGKVIHDHMSEIRYCYESALLRNPDLEGKMLVAFTISKEGRVKGRNVQSSSMADPRFEDCLLRRLMTWMFPKPNGGIDVTVTYPFIFKPLGK